MSGFSGGRSLDARTMEMVATVVDAVLSVSARDAEFVVIAFERGEMDECAVIGTYEDQGTLHAILRGLADRINAGDVRDSRPS